MILDHYKTVGIASDEDKLKLAAIFFDNVYNIDKTIEIPVSLIANTKIDTKPFDEIARSLKDKPDYLGILAEKLIPKYFENKELINRDEVIEIITQTQKETKAKTYNLFAIEVAKQLTMQKRIGIPLFNESILFDHLERDYLNDSNQEKVEIKIVNAPLISATELDWAQIVEAKKDEDFNKKVKRFCVFINKNYQGRGLPFIIDDLSIQIEDYQNACKKHGINLINETFKSLANSKSLFGTFGIAFCALLAQMPEYAFVTSAIGAGLEIMNLHITVRQYEDKFESFVNESPVSMIFELNRLKSQNF